MKGKRELAVLFFVIVALIFYISSHKSGKTRYELPELEAVKADDISRVSVRKGDSEIIVEKDNDQWRVGPRKYPADRTRVNAMIQDLGGMKLSALASESKNYTLYELDDKMRIDAALYKGDDVVRRVGIGKPASSSSHTFVRIGDDPRVYHAAGNFRSDFDTTVSNLRDKKVMTFSDDITQIVLKKGSDLLIIQRTEAPMSTETPMSVEPSKKGQDSSSWKSETPVRWKTDRGQEVKTAEIEQMVNTLSNFQCDGFIEDRTKDDFASPEYSVTLTGARSYVISFHDKTDGRYAAVSSESEYPFLVSEWKARRIMKDFKELIETGKAE